MKSVKQVSKRTDPFIRRELLIDATARCLAQYGAQGVSVRAICKEAGVTPGLLRHYFDGIDDCIAEAYRATGNRVEKALLLAVAAAPQEPRPRLLAYLTASFAPPISDAELLATWLAFWALTKTDPRIADLHAQIYGAYRGNLEILIGDYRPGDHRLTAVALTALVDGLWLELSLGNAPFSRDEAGQLVEKWLGALLP
jgi:TetR/AcrR family transcriptional regulator, transcriptional repressor of bet genes